MNTFYTLELVLFRSFCQDVATWSHGSPLIGLLEKFVEDIVYPSSEDTLHMTILKISFCKYKLNNELHQFSGYWSHSNMELSPTDSGCDFVSINRAIAELAHSKNKKSREKKARALKNEFNIIWEKAEKELNR